MYAATGIVEAVDCIAQAVERVDIVFGEFMRAIETVADYCHAFTVAVGRCCYYSVNISFSVFYP